MIGRLELLRAKFGCIIIPEAVRDELARLTHPQAIAAIGQAVADGWLCVEVVTDRRVLPLLLHRVDPGEAEALELARQTNADLLIIDDSDARRVAHEEELPYTGILGILAEEKLAGHIRSLKTEIDRLRSEGRFFISGKVERMILERVGE